MSEETTGTQGGSKESPAVETHQFQTEVSQLLNLLVHSLYTKREIFLRELVSNAADALNKVQFELLTQREVASRDAELAIDIEFDDEARTLSVKDTGIGMTRDELIENIGTIAHSGSKAFLKKLEAHKEGGANTALDLIGQFGVGFYSVFMVADKVTVESKSMIPDEKAYTWETSGEGQFTLEPSERTDRGTTVTLFLKDDASEFMSKYRLEDIVRTYSNFVPFPVRIKNEVANRQKAIWAESKAEITDEMYTEFYGHLAHTTQKPMGRLHLQADVPLQFNAILYLPHEAPPAYFPMEKRHGVRLYVKRMFIQDDCEELVPNYLRFMVGVVDVDDLPLNVSRELIQKNPLLGKVRSNLERKTLKMLEEIAKQDTEKYEKLWRQFGLYLKEGIREETRNKDLLAGLLRFNSSHHVDADGLTSLEAYLERMPEGQEEVYYFTGMNRESIERSPHLELCKSRHYEVLYMTDPIDPLVVMALGKYKEKAFRIIDDPALKPGGDDEIKKLEVDEKAVQELAGFMKKVLGDKIEDVRVSQRLVDSPSCLVNPENSMSSDMQRLYSLMDKDFTFTKKILEINPRHRTILNLAGAYHANLADPTGQEKLRPYIGNILDTALLAEGIHPNPTELVSSLNELLELATGTLDGAKWAGQPGAVGGTELQAGDEENAASEGSEAEARDSGGTGDESTEKASDQSEEKTSDQSEEKTSDT